MMKYFIVLMSLIISQNVCAHGSDKPGPHNGFIQMPGPFHTEVVPEKDSSYSVYLLDMNFQKPLVEKSEVKAWLKNGDKKSDLKCTVAAGSYYKCNPTDPKFSAQQLVVKAKRENVQGNEAVYDLPLKHSASH